MGNQLRTHNLFQTAVMSDSKRAGKACFLDKTVKNSTSINVVQCLSMFHAEWTWEFDSLARTSTQHHPENSIFINVCFPTPIDSMS